jgi:hypothetical protein
MANQTFTDSFRRKPINIDAAYVALQLPGDDLVKVIAGKMPNPVWQPLFGTPIFYDPDLMPEGIAEQFTWRFGDRQQYRLFANFGQFAVKELSTDANDVYFYDFEAGAEARLPHLRLTAAGGYYLTQNLRNLKVGDAPNTTGNTVAISKNVTNYFADFNVIYARAEAAWNFSDKPLLGTPSLLTLSGEYDNNLAGIYGRLADAQTTGWAVQLMLGEARKKGQWQVLYEYKYVEADAIWDALADSDYGLGGTDRKGHVIRFAYNLQDWWQLAFNTSITRKISKRPNTPCHNQQGINGEDLLRWQVDSTFKF